MFICFVYLHRLLPDFTVLWNDTDLDTLLASLTIQKAFYIVWVALVKKCQKYNIKRLFQLIGNVFTYIKSRVKV